MLYSMSRFTDPVLVLLLVLLTATLSAFLLGLISYPFGLLLLIVFIAARLFSLQDPRS
jgi:hypothetical protein